MDTFTQQHLEDWLERNVHEEERGQLGEQIIALFNSDPDFWSSHSWTEMQAYLESGQG
jgi:hypothetical protein